MKDLLYRAAAWVFAAVWLLSISACATRMPADNSWMKDPAFLDTPGIAAPPANSPPSEERVEPRTSQKPLLGFLGRKKASEEAAPPAAEERVVSVAPASPAPAPSGSAYRLKPGDSLIITLSGSLNLNEQIETVVDDRGFVKLRFIGAVRAEGRTATELEREIEAEYTDRQNIYKEIYARVVVPQTYYIGGEVRQPGRYPLTGRVTLSQAIVAAGNFTEWANARRIIIVRNNERMEINFRDIRSNPALDVELRAGDNIDVTRSTL